MQNTEKNFANGFIVSRRDSAPDFVISNVAINVAEFTNWVNTHKNDKGWINLDIKQSKNGKYYAEHNNWQPTEASSSSPSNADDDSDLPF